MTTTQNWTDFLKSKIYPAGFSKGSSKPSPIYVVGQTLFFLSWSQNMPASALSSSVNLTLKRWANIPRWVWDLLRLNSPLSLCIMTNQSKWGSGVWIHLKQNNLWKWIGQCFILATFVTLESKQDCHFSVDSFHVVPIWFNSNHTSTNLACWGRDKLLHLILIQNFELNLYFYGYIPFLWINKKVRKDKWNETWRQ